MNRNSLGDQIRDIVEDAVNSMNFSELNQQIKRTVNGALDEVRKTVGPYQTPEERKNNADRRQGWQNPYEESPRSGEQWQRASQQNQQNQQGQQSGQAWQRQNQRWDRSDQRAKRQNDRWENRNERRANPNERWGSPRAEQSNQRVERPRQEWKRTTQEWNNRNENIIHNGNYKSYGRYEVQKNRERMPEGVNGKGKPVGNVSGILLTVFGWIGTGLFGIGALVTYLVAFFTGIFTVLGPISAGLGVLFLGFLAMLFRGNAIRGRLRRYRDYMRVLKGNTFCSIEDMANFIGKSKRYVISDLRKMIRLGFFPEGHIDNKKTQFITTDETYTQYLASIKSYEERRKIEELEAKEKKWSRDNKKANNRKETNNDKNQTAEEAKAGNTEAVDENSELYKTIKAGRAHIIEIRQANDKIPGEEISKKLDRLEEVTTKIFICVEKHPEQLPEIRKFMEYYLPTTLKLVNAYREFDSQIVQGENITSAKTEIENTLDTINDAFERLLDSLFQDAAMEVSADISVLNTLLAQEGLTKRDFK
ncbi:MAG: hypothetical protein E7256_15760 [Lachnospiraceae bacterium]|nr:hypothetical protein [Lachnospiraceae bacterium]